MIAKLPHLIHDTLTVVVRDTMTVSYPDTVWTIAPHRGVSPEALWGLGGALGGVVLGFVLQEWGARRRRSRRQRMLRAALEAECRSLLSQIPDFVDIYQKAIDSLKAGRVLPTRAVAGISTIYRSNLAELSPLLTDKERNLLHVVFERVKVGDELLANQARDRIMWQGLGANPNSAFILQAQDQVESYRLAERLLRSVLDGNPEDVFRVQEGTAAAASTTSGALPGAAVAVVPPTHDVARHFLRIVGAARQALHGVEAKFGGGGFPVLGPRALRPDLQRLKAAIEEFKASEARVVELRQPNLEKKLSESFRDVEQAYADADKAVTQSERHKVGPGTAAQNEQFRNMAESMRAHGARLDAVAKEVEKLTA